MTTFSVHVLTIWGSANDAASNITETETKTHIPAGVRVTFACFVTPSHNVACCSIRSQWSQPQCPFYLKCSGSPTSEYEPTFSSTSHDTPAGV
jgi:hypothetical protein